MTTAVETNPLLTVAVGTYVDTYDNDREVRRRGQCNVSLDPVQAEDYSWTGVVIPHRHAQCSLPLGAHDVHVHVNDGRIMGRWNDATNLPEETEVDPEPEPFEPEIGVIYKFRNRPTMLLFVDKRKDGRLEVLDLDHEKYRVLKREQLVPRRDGKQPTPDQMLWVAKFLSERRKQVRDTAIEQKRNGYFRSVGDLNGVLRELEMEPHTPSLAGSFAPRFRIVANGRKSSGELERELKEWLKNLPTPPPGITFTEIGSRMNMDVREQ